MADEGFLRRWSRLKAEPVAEATAPAPETMPVSAPAPAADPAAALPQASALPQAAALPQASALPPPPTLEDAAALHADADFSIFVARNVDAAVRRLAMKKLFSDPHFQGHDGLDVYMGDYSVASPVSAAMVDRLEHSKSVFRKLDDAIDRLDATLAPDSDAAAAPAPEPAPAAPLPPPASPDQEVA